MQFQKALKLVRFFCTGRWNMNVASVASHSCTDVILLCNALFSKS